MTENNRRRRRRSSFNPTARDEAILTDLYFARLLTTDQIAARFWPAAGSVYFPSLDRSKADPGRKGGGRDGSLLAPMSPSVSSALRRLQRLAEEGLVVGRPHKLPDGRRTQVWMLSRPSFRREAEDLGRRGEAYPDWPKRRSDGSPGKLDHFVDTGDLYVAVAGELDDALGPHPSWEWRDERRAHDVYKNSWESARRYHEPDAEILFGGSLYIVERQTARSKKGPDTLSEKAANHEARAAYLGDGWSACIVFACDEPRDVENALMAARPGGLPLFAGTVGQVAVALADEAQKLVKSRLA